MESSQHSTEEPSVAQAIEIAKAAQQAALEAREDNDQLRKELAGKAAAEEAEAQGVTLSTEQQEAIADMTVEKMNQLGAFGPAEEEGSEGDALEQGVAQATASPGQAAPGGEGQPSPSGEQPQPPSGGVEGPEDESPRRKTLAERFQGR